MTDTSNAQDRTEQASPRRLQKAREEGQVVRAHAVAGALVMLAGAAVLLALGGRVSQLLQQSLTAGLSLAPEQMRESGRLLTTAGDIGRPALTVVAPFVLVMAAVAVAAELAIGGWTLSAKPLSPDFGRVDPLRGFGRLFSRDALAEIVKALVKFVAICAIAYWVVAARVAEFVHIAGTSWPFPLTEAAWLTAQVFLILAASLAGISLLEVPYQLWSHHERLRMTWQEVRDEQRETEGSPETRRRIRSLRLRLARMRMMTEVPKADVVITNPQHYAAALRYSEGAMRAPQLVAKGTGLIALRIREVAAEHNVPVVEAPPLSRAICRFVELGDEIPAGLYGAVAEVLAYVYRLKAAHDSGDTAPVAPQDGRFEPPPEYATDPPA